MQILAQSPVAASLDPEDSSKLSLVYANILVCFV